MEQITDRREANNKYVQKCPYCGCTYTYTGRDIKISDGDLPGFTTKETIKCPECGREEKAKKYQYTPETIEQIKSSSPLSDETKTCLAFIITMIIVFFGISIMLAVLLQ